MRRLNLKIFQRKPPKTTETANPTNPTIIERATAKFEALKKKVVGILRDPVYLQVILTSVLIIVSVIIVFAITAAWYTNTLSAGNLDFVSSEWGFSGNVDISAALIKASPGSSGVVPFTISNPTEQIISVSVNVSKTQMDGDVRQRVYFYIDDTQTVNGETVDKVYINSLSNYRYTVFPGQEHISTADTCNFSPLKWEWTLDVVGYYFEGTVSQGAVAVNEYLRPVIYDYDTATFDENGVLLTTDGTQTVAEFLTEISSKDGYAGTVDYASAVSGYYPVEVDANGNGVWLYLCNYGEIQLANEKDTALGDEAAAGIDTAQFSATMSIVGQQKKYNAAEVSDVQSFITALSDAEHDMVSLTGNLSLNATVEIPEGTDKVINCNGNTIETSFLGDMFVVENSSVVLLDGTFTGSGDNTYAVKVVNGEALLCNVDISNVGCAVYIRDNIGTGSDSSVHLSGCNISTITSSVFVCGNGSVSSENTCLTVDDCVISSETYFGIYGNGNEGWGGTDVQIRNSQIYGYWAGIYQPQRLAELQVYNSTVSGYTGIVVKGGNVLIDNSTVTGFDTSAGAVAPSAPAFSGSGYSDTGDGLYVETNYNYSINISVTGANTVIDGFSGYAVRMYEPTAAHASISLYGGSYCSDVSAFLPADCSCSYVGGRYVVTETGNSGG